MGGPLPWSELREENCFALFDVIYTDKHLHLYVYKQVEKTNKMGRKKENSIILQTLLYGILIPRNLLRLIRFVQD